MNFQEFKNLPEETKIRVSEIADNLRTAFATGGLDKEGNVISIEEKPKKPNDNV